MKIIYGTVAGLVTGFVASVLTAPRSGEQTLKNINVRMSKPVKNTRMLFNKVAWKLGIISEKKKAELNKATVTAFNAKRNTAKRNQLAVDGRALEKVHEKSGAAKPASASSNNKSTVRKVPAN